MRRSISLVVAALAATTLCARSEAADEPRRPNVVLIVADDLGSGDLGARGGKEIPTPHLDSLANEGVSCANAYISAPQCSPMRAGLLTGRYQQRFGHEFNAATPGSALDLEQVTLAQRLKEAGYVTGLVGKWHLGGDADHVPTKRGFDEFFGFLGGANPYLPKDPAGEVPRILRGAEDAHEKEYLTDAFAREAVGFIERHADEPFFLYLAFNATHGPLEAPAKYLDRFASIADPKRKTYAAMLSAMDDGVGRVLAELKARELEEETLVIFLADNGGPTGVNASSNAPFRGVKGETREGGIRTPFFLRWKGALPAGSTFDPMVISLDVFPTVLAAAEAQPPEDVKLDGANLLPHLRGQEKGVPHETLYWRFSFPPNQPDRYKWAIRRGNWKLLSDIDGNRNRQGTNASGDRGVVLIDLSKDVAESRDLSAEFPEKRQELLDAWNAWNAELPAPPAQRADVGNADAS